MQEQEAAKECTFRPKLNASTAVRGDAGDDPNGFERPRIPLYERLHKEAREREAVRALAQHHLEAEILRECTFQVTMLLTLIPREWLLKIEMTGARSFLIGRFFFQRNDLLGLKTMVGT